MVDDAPPSFAQERFWFLDRLGQGGVAYHSSAPLRLSGPLNVDALERALREIVRRHDALRTTFRESDGILRQVIARFEGFILPVEDLSTLDEAERESEAQRRTAIETARPFDLVAGLLFRASLLRLGAEEHVLLLCMHHIITDGWSWVVFFRELWILYDAYRSGQESPLPELPVQYTDYAAWQRDQSNGEAEARQLAYWREQLAGAPALLELPTDRPRPLVPTLKGNTVPVHVPLDVLQPLQDLARSEGATLFMVMLAGFDLLLSRYTGSDDIVVGTLVAGRTRREVQDLIGLFMNTLVLRTRLPGDLSFREAVGRVRETVLAAYEHQELPFVKLVEELQPERSLSRASLFQVLFQMEQIADGSGTGSPGLRARSIGTPREAAKLDLTLDLHAHARGIDGILEYSTDLFERSTVARMAEHLVHALKQVAANPDLLLSDVSLAGAEERRRVVDVWNQTQRPYPDDVCIHELFEMQAVRTPDAVAVTCGDESTSFAELNARANTLAHHLVHLGVRPEVRVGLCLERSPELMVAILGVLKAGGAYVPIDARFPAERIAYMVTDAGVTVLLTQAALRERLEVPDAIEVVDVDEQRPLVANESATTPVSGVGPENLCYVIYTSGSTGRPKGVAMHHRGVCNYIDWGIDAYGADAGRGAPVFTSMAVDLTITNLLPLFSGKPVHLLPEENPIETLARMLRARPGFGLIKITPVHLSLLTPLLTPEEARAVARTLVIGADFLTAEPTVFWQEHAPNVRLMNEYGPTETVVGCSAYTIPVGVHRHGPVPVGGAIQNLRFYVLDSRLQPVPVGLPGELYIGGVGVARGYLGRPGLSADKFMPDPFAEPGWRMYRTGDRARWREDGNLLILGRTDHQVKIRGYRVELGEIDAALRRHEAVSECLVVVREDRPDDKRLVAYVVGDATPSELREHVQRSLPDYMVPSAFVKLDALPETPTGKLDRRALPPPEYDRGESSFDAPRDFLEVQLVHVWEELLGVSPISCTQNFFELGGNSLLALRLFAEINRRLQCDLPLTTLFTGATVRQMAAAILDQRSRTPGPLESVIPLQPKGALPPLFCVHPAGRAVHRYVNIVRHLGADQPAFGVRDVGADLARPMAQIAAEHVHAIRAVQPEGPYYLLGWSFGGALVYEMAAQLEREGQRTAFVGVFDTAEPLVGSQLPTGDDAYLVASLASEIAEDMGRPFSIRPEELRGMPFDDQVRRAVEALHAQEAAPPEYDAAALRESCAIIRARNKSREGYVPGTFSGSLTLFRPNDARHMPDEFASFSASWTDEERRTFCWCRRAPNGVEVHWIPGTHVTMGTEPNVRVLAARLRESLAAARERTERRLQVV